MSDITGMIAGCVTMRQVARSQNNRILFVPEQTPYAAISAVTKDAAINAKSIVTSYQETVGPID